MKRYFIQLRTDEKNEGGELNTRKQIMTATSHYLASTTESCVIVIIRRKKEVKSGSKNKRRAHR
jgi:hypothetical protein